MNKTAAIPSLLRKIDALNKKAFESRVHDFPRSLKNGEEALRLSKKAGYKGGEAIALRTVGFCYLRLAKYKEAKPLLERSLTMLRSMNDLPGESLANQYLCILHRGRGNFRVALEMGFRSVELSERANAPELTAENRYQVGITYKLLGQLEKALEYLFQASAYYEETNNPVFRSYPIQGIGSIYFESRDFQKALEFFKQALKYRLQSNDQLGSAGSMDSIGFTYFKLKEYKKAISHCTKSLAISKKTKDTRAQANAMAHLAEVYKATGDIPQAIRLSEQSMQLRKKSGEKRGETELLLFQAGLSLGEEKSARQKQVSGILRKALSLADKIQATDLQSRIHYQLYAWYIGRKDFENALQHLATHVTLEKEHQQDTVNQKMQNLEITYQAEQLKKETDIVRGRNEELTRLNSEIKLQKQQLEKTLADLRSAQAQLVHAEKMASLGELTAGIAHEIQNPLNFVNNFSEINKELIEELNAERIKPEAERNDRMEEDILKDIKDNSDKISHHGKRADAIVKGMLQHSRSSSGQKEATDINMLCDEYVRLAYHGLRAKDKSFNAKCESRFDSSLPKIQVVPQDLGRVILNLINNAFYAVNEKQKLLADSRQPTGIPYEPTVKVSTEGSKGMVEIKVTDNGNGIPQSIMDKIFQPFFTTKPTGEGTGLGLSLSYDIVKAHGGELVAETKYGEGTTFTILLAQRN